MFILNMFALKNGPPLDLGIYLSLVLNFSRQLKCCSSCSKSEAIEVESCINGRAHFFTQMIACKFDSIFYFGCLLGLWRLSLTISVSSWEFPDSNPLLRGKKRKCYLCAMLPPIVRIRCFLRSYFLLHFSRKVFRQ